jgi:ribulose bisphosphate carboxylase small subunit
MAVQFYLSQGWQIAREFAHEKYHHAMLEMGKSTLTASSSPGQR